jgi:hypothetical protein
MNEFCDLHRRSLLIDSSLIHIYSILTVRPRCFLVELRNEQDAAGPSEKGLKEQIRDENEGEGYEMIENYINRSGFIAFAK